jgi:addiction module RelE/StbE family toxin
VKKINIYYTPEFIRLWRKIPKQIKNKAVKREKIFRENPFHPQLKTHKLKGALSGFYSFYIDYHWRIVFHFQGKDIYFDAIGTHAIYQ